MPVDLSKMTRAPRGRALTIGLNDLDSKYYGNEYTPLKGAENDARAMSDLARERGFECMRLLGPEATCKRVTSEISEAAPSLDAGDIFLLSFSGHGSAISPSWIENLDPRPNSVEPGEWVQTWVLWDRELLDKELRTMWTRFSAGVRVLVVLDSCHSFTAIEWVGMTGSGATDAVLGADAGSSDTKPPTPRFRLYSEELQLKTLAQDGDYYAGKLREALTRAEAQELTGARVLSLAACQDKQLARDGDRLGLFTEMLLSAWSSKAWPDYCSFLAEIEKEVLRQNPFQKPGLFPYPPDRNSFAAQPPFAIIAGQ